MTNSLSAFSSMLLFLENFHGCFGTSSGMARPSLVKLPIKESVVKVNHSLCSWYYLIRFAQYGLLKVQSSFIKLMCLTCYG